MQIGLMSLGDLLTNPVTSARVSESERHRSIVDQAVLGEQLGFSSMHLGEHHFSDYQLSSPPVVLAAIAEHTSSMRLSTSVTLAGNLDPVRMAEDYATVDVLSGGRAEIVVGRGNLFVRTYEGFGQPLDTAQACAHTHVASTEAEAAKWQVYYRHYWNFVGGLLGGKGTWPDFDFDELRAGPGIVGSPAQAVDRIGQWHELLGLDRHLFMFDLGGIGEPALTATIELFGTEVLPHIATLGRT